MAFRIRKLEDREIITNKIFLGDILSFGDVYLLEFPNQPISGFEWWCFDSPIPYGNDFFCGKPINYNSGAIITFQRMELRKFNGKWGFEFAARGIRPKI